MNEKVDHIELVIAIGAILASILWHIGLFGSIMQEPDYKWWIIPLILLGELLVAGMIGLFFYGCDVFLRLYKQLKDGKDD